jgi:WD repeat-containing protein 19
MDLLEWDVAQALAKKLAPEKISKISLEYGTQLEMEGRYGEAHSEYETAYSTAKGFIGSGEDASEHQWLCHAGLTRMSFALGDIHKGMTLLNGVTNKQLLENCVIILESIKQFNEAAVLWERVGCWDKAAVCWIKSNNS